MTLPGEEQRARVTDDITTEGTATESRAEGETAENGTRLPLRPVLTVTEEELLVLTSGDLGPVPAQIELPEDPDRAELISVVATRSLMARGLLEPTTDTARSTDGGSTSGGGTGGAAGGWVATEPLGLALVLRESAPCVLGLQRVLGSDPDDNSNRVPEPTTAIRYLHLHEEVAVIEDVTPAGMHSLLTVPAGRYEEAVVDFVVPPGAEPGAGPVRVLGEGEGAVADLLAAIGAPTVLVEAAILAWGASSTGQAREPVTCMLALGPGGTFRSLDSRHYHPMDPVDVVKELLGYAVPDQRPASATMGG